MSQEQAWASECQATWQAPHSLRLQAPAQAELLGWARCLLPSLLWRRHLCSGRSSSLLPPCAQVHCLPRQQAPPPASHLGLPLPSCPFLALFCPLGSNRSSRGQNTISFNKLNLLRLLITSGVGSDQRQKEEAAAPGVLVEVVGGEGGTHCGRQITTWPRGPLPQ